MAAMRDAASDQMASLSFAAIPAASGWMWWLPRAALAFFLISLTALLWISWRSGIEEQRVTLISDMLWLEQEIHFHLTRNEEQLQQLARASSPVHPRASTFEPQSRSLLANQTGLNQIFWLDASGALRAALPSATAEAVTVGEATPAIPMQETMRLARALAKPAYSPTYAIVLNDAQFEVHVPEFSNGRYAGMVVGIYSIRRILDELVPWWLAERYRISIVDDSGVLGSKSMVAAVNSQMLYQVPFDPPGHSLILRAEAYEPKTSLARNLLIFSVLALAGSMLWSLWALRRHIQWRQAAELALRKEYAFRAAMEDSLATGLLARDHDGSIIYVNPAFCRLVGYGADEIVGHRPPLPYWDAGNLDVSEKQKAGTEPQQGFESQLRHRDGHIVRVMVNTAALVDGDGRHFGWLSSILDITEARRLEDHARQQDEKLQFTARLVAMGEMASSLAHELNQPLAAVSSYSTGCLNRIEQGEIQQAELVDALQKIGRQAHRAGAIIRRIYEFVRRSEPRQAPVDLRNVIVDAGGLLEGEARKRGIRIRLQIEPDLPQVIGDRVLLEQVLINLMKNGIESMLDTGAEHRELIIMAKCVEKSLYLSVADHGVGIPGEDVEKIFMPFFTTKPEGMGMGLNICRSIVEGHHGRLWYESNPRGGSVFVLSLPLPSAPPK